MSKPRERDDHISIALKSIRRDLRNKVTSVSVLVMYEIGEFPLAFQIDRVPTEKEELDKVVRALVTKFAGDLRKAAQRPIQIPLPRSRKN